MMASRMRQLEELLSGRIAVLDGAAGTMLQRVAPGGNADSLNLAQPALVTDLHRAYLAAGADILKTNTFNATAIVQADHGLADRVEDLNRQGARLARAAADAAERDAPGRSRFVAGVLGPTHRSAAMSADAADPAARAIGFDALELAYRAAGRALIEGGADLLLIETVFDTLNAKAAIDAVLALRGEMGHPIPLMISATVADKSGRTLSGQTMEAFWHSVAHAAPLSVGLNCAFGAEALRPSLQALARVAPVPVSVHPNAGLPDAFGAYGDGPETMAASLAGFAEEGIVNIVGGCCGTTPAHIAAIAAALRGRTPRAVPAVAPRCRLAGLESLTLDPAAGMVLAGDRLNVAGSAAFRAAILKGDHRAALGLARAQIEAGAQIIDIHVDEPMIDAPAAMETFLRHAQAEPDIACVPVMVDTSQWAVAERALKNLQGKGIVNSISLKEGEETFLAQARAIRALGAAVVVMAFDERGQADRLDRMIEICARSYRLLVERAGFPPEDIVFDPNLFPVATGLDEGRGAARDFLAAVAEIKRSLPHAATLAGVSAVSFSFRGNARLRTAMHAVFLYHARQAGLDVALANAAELTVYDDLDPDLRMRIEDVIFDRRADATERLLEAAHRAPVAAAHPTAASWRTAPVADRLAHALVHGIDDFVVTDVEEARSIAPTALAVIEGPLMAGMARVGDLFQAGALFLPQMVKSARVMKRAVAHLVPFMERERAGAAATRGRILLATVRGDVHDIGKSIVAVVLRCNNYEVVDLGVMVPAERIVEALRAEPFDAVGLSGLITPSLDEMAVVAAELERAGFALPLLIGGAATSRPHTAVRIAPAYGGPVLHVSDAARAVGVMAAVSDPAGRGDYLAGIERDFEAIRARFSDRMANARPLDLAAARASGLAIDFRAEPPPAPRAPGVHAFADEDLAAIAARIDWTPFLRAWGFDGAYPALLSDRRQGAAARELFADAQAMLARMIAERWIAASAAVGIFPAARDGDDVVVYADPGRSEVAARIPFLRQQMAKTGGRANLCLADFVTPLDHIGVFALTAGHGLEDRVAALRAAGDDHGAILAAALADRLAEAYAEHLHERVRRELWGYAPDEALSNEDLIAGRYAGIRPAPGYPACPDHGLKRTILALLGGAVSGLGLTETWAMTPAASLAGFYFAHPRASYFGVGRIGRDQVTDYAARSGLSVAETERRLAQNLAYEPRN